jgi:hypothetical protein
VPGRRIRPRPAIGSMITAATFVAPTCVSIREIGAA